MDLNLISVCKKISDGDIDRDIENRILGGCKEWKKIDGYLLDYYIHRSSIIFRVGKEVKTGRKASSKIMRQWTDQNGYKRIFLRHSSNRNKPVGVHRLVALSFVENPDNLPVVNHLNGIKHDNRAENLQWCTQQDNILHAFDTRLHKRRKPVLCISDGKIYHSATQAAKATGLSVTTVSRIAKGIYGFNAGLDFRYLSREELASNPFSELVNFEGRKGGE